MNIGILTHCVANNFGANLQALSTACYLRNHGYNPIFLLWNEYLNKRSTNMDSRQLEMHRTFLLRQGFKITSPCHSDNDFVRSIKENNIHNIIVGSDAVFTISTWLDRLHLTKYGIGLRQVTADQQFPNPFWIPFADNLEHCNFFYLSPSCQSTNYRFIPKRIKEEIKKCILKFENICARDTCTCDMVKHIVGEKLNIPITPDPVWGITYNLKTTPSKENIKCRFNLPDKYILMSFYNQRSMPHQWFINFEKLAGEHGFAVFGLPMPQGDVTTALPHINIPLDPIDWYSIIKYSSGYVGNNMHPIIVAMHNAVPFFSIDQHGKSFLKMHFEKTSKVYDLLNRFDLLDCRAGYYTMGKIEPQVVLNKLLYFDTNKCRAISQKMEVEYINMMNNMTKHFYETQL